MHRFQRISSAWHWPTSNFSGGFSFRQLRYSMEKLGKSDCAMHCCFFGFFFLNFSFWWKCSKLTYFFTKLWTKLRPVRFFCEINFCGKRQVALVDVDFFLFLDINYLTYITVIGQFAHYLEKILQKGIENCSHLLHRRNTQSASKSHREVDFFECGRFKPRAASRFIVSNSLNQEACVSKTLYEHWVLVFPFRHITNHLWKETQPLWISPPPNAVLLSMHVHACREGRW